MSDSSEEHPTAGPTAPLSGWLTSSGASSQGRFTPGVTLAGRYRIVGLLGRGGMGEVYRADDLRLDLTVALKFLPPDVTADPVRLTQFHREVRTARQVSHPNVCRVHDIGEVDDHLFVSMEFVEGEDLAKTLRRIGRFPEDKGIEVVRQLCAGLEAIHASGLVHRDLKPANIMLDEAGKVRVMDFGLAAAAGVDDSRAGTPGYMAPEQFLGGEVTVRSDVYALGVVLYELFTGRRPFTAATLHDLTEDQQAGRFTPPRHVVGSIAPAVDHTIVRCLAPDPALRPPSAAAVAASLADDQALSREKTGDELRSLAVLPFTLLGSGEDEEYLGVGLADVLITSLTNLSGVVVRPTSAIRQYATRAEGVLTAARTLQVDAILEGTIQRAGSRVRATVQLVDVRLGAPIWAQRFDEAFTDLFAVQDAIVQRIVDALTPRLSPDEKRRVGARRTSNPEAYHAYLRGRFLWSKRTRDGLEQALSSFRRAIELDPTYALAYVGLAECYVIQRSLGWPTAPDTARVAAAAATRALEIDDQIAEAHAALAVLRVSPEWDWAGAQASFQRALELAPNYATAHNWYANYLAAVGRLDDAIVHARRAVDLDPLNVVWRMGVGNMLFLARRYDAAIREEQSVLAMEPRFPLAHWVLGMAYEQVGDLERAIDTLRVADECSESNLVIRGLLGRALALAGRREEARGILHALASFHPQSNVPPESLGLVYAGLGEFDAAFEQFERAALAGSFLLAFLNVSPLFDALRADSRFAGLLELVRSADKK